MNWIYPWLATAATLTLAATQPTPQEHPSPAPAHAAARDAASGTLFSKRALRRSRLLIQMRLLELREQQLACVRAAILRRLPPDLRPDATGSTGAEVKQSSAPGATTSRSAVWKSEDCEWLSIQPKRRRRAA